MTASHSFTVSLLWQLAGDIAMIAMDLSGVYVNDDFVVVHVDEALYKIGRCSGGRQCGGREDQRHDQN